MSNAKGHILLLVSSISKLVFSILLIMQIEYGNQFNRILNLTNRDDNNTILNAMTDLPPRTDKTVGLFHINI